MIQWYQILQMNQIKYCILCDIVKKEREARESLMEITSCLNGNDDPLNQWLDAHCNKKRLSEHVYRKVQSITSSTSGL